VWLWCAATTRPASGCGTSTPRTGSTRSAPHRTHASERMTPQQSRCSARAHEGRAVCWFTCRRGLVHLPARLVGVKGARRPGAERNCVAMRRLSCESVVSVEVRRIHLLHRSRGGRLQRAKIPRSVRNVNPARNVPPPTHQV